MKKQYLIFDHGVGNNGGGAPDPKEKGSQNEPQLPDMPNPPPSDQPRPCKGDVDSEQIKAWKKQHPQGIYSLVFNNPNKEDELEHSRLYFRKPNRNDLNYSKTKRDPEASDEQWIALADVTCIGGDKSIMQDEQTMISICYYMEAQPVGEAFAVVNL